MDAQVLRAALSPATIALDAAPPAGKDELFRRMSAQLAAEGRIGDEAAFIAALEEREAMGPTYMGDGLAIPHGKSATVGRPSIAHLRLARPMRYESCGEVGEVDRVFMLAVPDGGEQEHLAALAFLARALIDDGVAAALRAAATPEEAVEALLGFVEAEERRSPASAYAG